MRFLKEKVHAKAPRTPRKEEKEQSLYKIFEERNYLCELCGLSELCVRFLEEEVHAKAPRTPRREEKEQFLCMIF